MRLPMMSVRSFALLVSVVALQACAPPEGMPDQAADAALRAQAEAEANMEIVLPNGVSKLKCKDPVKDDSPPVLVGPDGDTLTTAEHTLIIPEGALSTTVRFHLIEGKQGDGKLVIVAKPEVTLPDSLPAVLTLAYAHCTIPANSDSLSMYRAPAGNSNATIIAAQVNDTTKTATAKLHNFSTYLMGAN